MAIKRAIIEENLRPTITSVDCPKELVDLMKDCWNASPQLRPSFNQIVGRLQKILGSS